MAIITPGPLQLPTTSYSSSDTVVNDTSICPKGWRLPKGSDKSNKDANDYWGLIVNSINNGILPENYNSSNRPYYSGSNEVSPISNALRHFPNNFVWSGYYYNDSALNRSTIGSYWTSATGQSNSAYLLNIESSRLDPGTGTSNKHRGYSIRCLKSE